MSSLSFFNEPSRYNHHIGRTELFHSVFIQRSSAIDGDALQLVARKFLKLERATHITVRGFPPKKVQSNLEFYLHVFHRPTDERVPVVQQST